MADSDIPVKELIGFLSVQGRPDVRAMAMSTVLGMTAADNRDEFFKQHPEFIAAILEVANDRRYESVSREAISALVNLSTNQEFVETLVGSRDLIGFCMHVLNDQTVAFPDQVCMLLSNLTRDETVARKVATMSMPPTEEGGDKETAVMRLVNILCLGKSHNPNGNFDYVATVLLNVTQIAEGRALFLSRG